MGLWYPIIMAVFGLGRLFQGKDGKSPAWLLRLTGAMFRGVWASYDGFFKGLFGDGERTIEGCEGGLVGGEKRRGSLVRKRRDERVQEEDGV